MARIVKSRRRSSGGKIARKAKSAARRVVVKTKKVYRAAKGVKLSKKDVIVSVAAGGAGAIGAAVVLKKLPIENEWVKNGAVAAAGGALSYFGMKKKQWAVASAGIGMAAVAASNIISKALPAGTLAAPYINTPRLAAPIIHRRPVAAPFVNTPRMVRVNDEDYI